MPRLAPRPTDAPNPVLTFRLSADAAHPAATVRVQARHRPDGDPRVVAATLRLDAAPARNERARLLADGEVVVDLGEQGRVLGVELLGRDAALLARAIGEYDGPDPGLVRDACATVRVFWLLTEHLLRPGVLATSPDATAPQPGEWVPELAPA